jgi:hypothetical protein
MKTQPKPIPRPKLRTSLKAGGLLDEAPRTPREPARDADGNPLPDWWV